MLEAAYDDALGVTAAFNLNLLRHLNRLIGSDFRPEQWRHVAFFDAARSRIEMQLEARSALAVHWPGGGRAFRGGERIETENLLQVHAGRIRRSAARRRLRCGAPLDRCRRLVRGVLGPGLNRCAGKGKYIDADGC